MSSDGNRPVFTHLSISVIVCSRFDIYSPRWYVSSSNIYHSFLYISKRSHFISIFATCPLLNHVQHHIPNSLSNYRNKTILYSSPSNGDWPVCSILSFSPSNCCSFDRDGRILHVFGWNFNYSVLKVIDRNLSCLSLEVLLISLGYSHVYSIDILSRDRDSSWSDGSPCYYNRSITSSIILSSDSDCRIDRNDSFGQTAGRKNDLCIPDIPDWNSSLLACWIAFGLLSCSHASTDNSCCLNNNRSSFDGSSSDDDRAILVVFYLILGDVSSLNSNGGFFECFSRNSYTAVFDITNWNLPRSSFVLKERKDALGRLMSAEDAK